MKTRVYTLFIAFSLLFTAAQSAKAQKRVEDLPQEVSWNLFNESRDKFQYRKDRVNIRPKLDSLKVWTKPEDILAKLLYVTPADMGFSNDFRVSQFVGKVMKEKNAGPCPQWVPVQLFRNLDYVGEAVWILVEKHKGQSQVVGLGKNPFKGSKAFVGGLPEMELFGYNHEAMSNPAKATWVFVQYE